MRKEIVIFAAIVVITISAAVVAVANLSVDPGNTQQMKALTQDLAAPSQMTALDAAGNAGLQVLHAFDEPPDEYIHLPMPYNASLSCQIDTGYITFITPPRPFIVEKVGIIGIYDNESGYIPFALELRDDKGKLLYELTDISVAYFPSKVGLAVIEIPAIKIDGDFSVTFYSRTSVALGAYLNKPNSMSFVVERGLNAYPLGTPEGDLFDWAISVAGRDA
ncbi:MAG: hypothetical protein U9O90_05290 [Euryarchaeota archaeon]|nr:hypothetical protein [Euryarchaeota archaeon]